MKIFVLFLVINAASNLVYCKCISAGWCVFLLSKLNTPKFTYKAKVEEGSARQLVKKFDVKKREYFGNTSMEAEISLLMANQALV
jgi:hypothetical protein